MESQTLNCSDCGNSFEFTADEQKFYQEKGFQTPKRCPNCRRMKKDQRRSQFTQVECSNCHVMTEVPFVPKGDKPVYCRDCFQKMRQGA